MLFQCGQSPTRAASLKRRPFPNTWPDRIRIPGEQPDGGGGGGAGLHPTASRPALVPGAEP